MTLHIARLSTHCIAPRGREAMGGLVDGVARATLARELFERLGPSLDRQAPVLRIRRLNVKISLTPQDMERGRLAEVWAAALARALHEALARPDGEGELLRRFDSRAAYIAAAIAFFLHGQAAGRPWQFPEFEAKARLPAAIAAFELLIEAGPLLGDVLETLRRAGDLARALGLIDEVGLERLLRAVAETEEGGGALNFEQFVTVAKALLALGAAPGGGEAATRRRAIELWLRFERRAPLRGLFHAIRLLLLLLQEQGLLARARAVNHRSDARAPDGVAPLPPGLAEKMSRFPPWCEALRRELVQSRPPDAIAALEQLRAITPTAARAGSSSDQAWRTCDDAGLLLLYPVIRRLGWIRLSRDPAFGPRAFQALVAGAAMRLLRPWEPGEKIELAPALLAGMTAEADRLGVAQALMQASPGALDLFPPAQDWLSALDPAANALARAFASRIRGFAKADRATIVRHFMRLPGRVLIDEKELRVALDPGAWGIVLHICGADDAVAEVEWLGGRSVAYVLEGL